LFIIQFSPPHKATLEVMSCIHNFISVVMCFQKIPLIIPFTLPYLCSFILTSSSSSSSSSSS
jgi:hypothetical protein